MFFEIVHFKNSLKVFFFIFYIGLALHVINPGTGNKKLM